MIIKKYSYWISNQTNKETRSSSFNDVVCELTKMNMRYLSSDTFRNEWDMCFIGLSA